MSTSFWNNEAAYRMAREGLNRRLAAIKCPDHGKSIRAVGSGQDLQFEQPCCKKLEALVIKALR